MRCEAGRLLAQLMIGILLSACYAGELEEEMVEGPFFPLATFMESEIGRLEAEQPEATKTVSLNGSEESQTRSDFDYRADLLAFKNADINKPSWFDKYETREGDGNVTYVATDSALVVRSMTVEGPVDNPSTISILRRTGSILSDGRQTLTYIPHDSYRIVTRQENRFADNVDGVIEVSFR